MNCLQSYTKLTHDPGPVQISLPFRPFETCVLESLLYIFVNSSETLNCGCVMVAEGDVSLLSLVTFRMIFLLTLRIGLIQATVPKTRLEAIEATYLISYNSTDSK